MRSYSFSYIPRSLKYLEFRINGPNIRPTLDLEPCLRGLVLLGPRPFDLDLDLVLDVTVDELAGRREALVEQEGEREVVISRLEGAVFVLFVA